MSEQMLYTCTPRKVAQFTQEILASGLVPFIESSPGMGKSSIVRQLAKNNNLALIDHRLSTSAPEDLSGLPRFRSDGLAEFAPFADLFPLEGMKVPDGSDGWLLFLDEFNSASKAVQAASYKLILDRMTGQKKLHANVGIVGAGNLATDRAITNPMGTAMQSRLVTLRMVVSFEEWLYDVALPNGYDHRVIAFLSQYPSKLMDFNPNHSGATFCCPRTWEFMEALVYQKPITQDRIPMYAGTISAGIAVEFVQFVAVFDTIVKIPQIVADPANCPLPLDAASRWAVISTMMEHACLTNFTQLCEYANRFTLDFKVLFYRSVLVRNASLRTHPSFMRAMVELNRYLNG
jgi:hypothetical protein